MKNALAVLGLLVAASFAFAGEGSKDMKCPVSGKAAKKSISYEHNGAKVYFCCKNCCKNFAKDATKFAAKANHQIAATGQAKQTGCPFSGKKSKSSITCNIDGVTVAFCCKHCQGKVAKTAAKDRVGLVFSDKAFKKGFQVKK